MISVELHHARDNFSLDAQFTVSPGLTVLFGRSGAGKSTIINAVAGLIRPDAGRIVVGGRVLFDGATGICLPPQRRRLGYVFQDARLFPHLSVRQNLDYGRWFARPKAPEADVAKVVEMLGLGGLLDRRPASLSGGEKQRVALGRAMLASPQLILADEPLAALDEARKAEIIPYFERLRDEAQVPILYVSHSPAEVARLATTVVALENGRVSRAGPAAEVLADPAVMPVGVRGAGALVDAVVARHEPDGLTVATVAGHPVFLPQIVGQPGQHLRLRIEAQEVMIALDQPSRISALNVLPAVVKTLRKGEGPGVMVQLGVGENTILARITQRSATTLELRPGLEVWAVVKAVSIARGDVG